MKRNKMFKVILSFEPAYQIIYWSVCWLTFFIAVIAALEYTTFNWISVLFGILTVGLIILARALQLSIENQQFIFAYFRKKKIISAESITKIMFSSTRGLILFNNDDVEPYRFYLNQKNKQRFLSYVKVSYPGILLEEQQEIFSEY
ncbi:EbsA family protein [Desemzia incerta]|uniref:EbsA family protein n=1 Tax=Desemzia incerta TaxID=82801 RepID=UPI0024C27F87|nr:EbsA family protein [Desemzia incerta]WHZ31622.1 EbsA family protein [Desemzia incerta]